MQRYIRTVSAHLGAYCMYAVRRKTHLHFQHALICLRAPVHLVLSVKQAHIKRHRQLLDDPRAKGYLQKAILQVTQKTDAF